MKAPDCDNHRNKVVSEPNVRTAVLLLYMYVLPSLWVLLFPSMLFPFPFPLSLPEDGYDVIFTVADCD
jgi:hypothetical protein